MKLKRLILRPDYASSLREFTEALRGSADSLSKLSSSCEAASKSAGRLKEEKKIQGPPIMVVEIDTEITASDEELYTYFLERLAQERIDRMDMIERMTHAAATLSGNTQEEELAIFNAALRNHGFDFNKALISYLV